MENLEIVCPDCGTTYEVKPEQAGKLLHCQCGRFLVAADKSTHEEIVDDEPVVDLKRPSSASTTPPPQKVAFREAEEDESEYPKTEKVDYAALIRERQAEASKRYDHHDATEDEPAPPAPPKVVEKPKPVVAPNIPPIETPVINVKAAAPKPIPAEPAPTHSPETVFEPKTKAAPKTSLPMDQQKMIMIGGGVAVLVLIVAGFLYMRSGSGGDASAATPTPAKTSTTAAANTSTLTPVAATGPAPAAGNCSTEHPANGTTVARSLLGSGMGRLEIENQTPSDVAVRLVSDNSLTIAWVYVQQGQTAAMPAVPLGAHRMLYEAGTGWNAETLTFNCNDAYYEWPRSLGFSERREDERSLYTNLKITLGKAKVSTISKDDFLKGHVGGA